MGHSESSPSRCYAAPWSSSFTRPAVDEQQLGASSAPLVMAALEAACRKSPPTGSEALHARTESHSTAHYCGCCVHTTFAIRMSEKMVPA